MTLLCRFADVKTGRLSAIAAQPAQGTLLAPLDRTPSAGGVLS